METPRRRVDWLQPALTAAVVAVLSYGANGLGKLKGDVSDLLVTVGRMETAIQLDMADRFTGQQGSALAARLGLVEELCSSNEGRLD